MKNVLTPITILSAVDLTSTQTSPVVSIRYLDNISVQLDLTGTPSGTLEVQLSNNYTVNPDGTPRNPGTWVTLTEDAGGDVLPIVITSGDPTPSVQDFNQLGAAYLRVVWAPGDGTDAGTGTVVVMGKGV